MLSSFSFMGKTWFNRSKTSTHSHLEEEIERGHEEEREGSPIPISTPKVRNCEIIDWLNEHLLYSFKSLGRTRLVFFFELKREFYIEFGVLLMTSF